ncbi:MAG: SPOR domain-containing protein [Paludibacteraceae bacterium]|nr:SPOR domain-containing protein [Paludibacteraceae bacterium]
MKKAISILLCTFIVLALSANDSIAKSNLKIIQAMEENVVVHQSADIDRLIQDKIDGTQREEVQIQGYRVQVFSSNHQQTAKNAAFDVEKQIKESDLDVDIYVLYNPPFWKVRLGDFRNQQDAALLRDEVLRLFPQLQGDTYIVRDQITILQ